MSLLHQDTSELLDDAARGEELTRGTSHIVVAWTVAAVVVAAAIAAYFIAGQRPVVATAEVTSVQAHWMHMQSSGVDAAGAARSVETADQELLFAHLRIHNQTNHPLLLQNVISSITLADGVHSSYQIDEATFSRLFTAYPEFGSLRERALPRNLKLQPGESVEGLAVTAFHLSREQWAARGNLSYTVRFEYEPALEAKLSVPLTER